MKCSVGFGNAALGICLAASSGLAVAGESAFDFSLHPTVSRANNLQSFVLTANDAAASNAGRNVASAAPAKQAEFREPLFSLNKSHEYLGVATLISAFATMMTAPGRCEANCANQPPKTSGTHQSLGRATRTLALASVVTGVVAHWDDMHLFEDGLSDPDTQHWLLAGAGALLLANAVSKAPARGHAAQAELGAAAMLVAVKLVW
jgi:hypothetical protein